MNDITWYTKTFDQLTTHELYDILSLRAAVFVVEQDCAYQDIDYKDQRAIHLTGYIDEHLVAYTRLFIGEKKLYKYAEIGRVIVAPSHRKQSLGKLLMKESMDYLLNESPIKTIKISAQCYLDRFYTSLGFRSQGDSYLEDGIPHQEMIFSPHEK